MKHAPWIVALFILVTGACGAFAQAPSSDLKKLLDDEWAWRLHENPLFATAVGDHSTDDKLPSMTVADQERPEKDLRGFQKRWQGIDRTVNKEGQKVQLFKFTWQNPRPQVEIRSLDVISAVTNAAPFVVAITVE